LAGLVLLVILFGSRLRLSRRKRKTTRQQYTDPLTQPIAITSMEPPTGKKKSLRRGKPNKVTDAAAWLIRLTPDGEPASVTAIPISAPELTLGTDPVQSAYILDAPSISPLHARIQQTESGYVIFDQNSIAGTWVNYEPVAREGHPLKHGDRVHFGQLMYRFELKDPPIISGPTLTPVDS
jgi:pSer/pThr/pTyr-binding forkhead associated (FHA) protein